MSSPSGAMRSLSTISPYGDAVESDVSAFGVELIEKFEVHESAPLDGPGVANEQNKFSTQQLYHIFSLCALPQPPFLNPISLEPKEGRSLKRHW